jgi:hypothetical protein
MRTYRVLAFSLIVMFVTAGMLSGCSKQEPPPSTGGYYDGPMKPKGSSTAKTDEQANPTGTATGTSTGTGK